jgi:Tol biopolymer transport system component/DNA-binding winged helix-turn-helix (wHTH) protein
MILFKVVNLVTWAAKDSYYLLDEAVKYYPASQQVDNSFTVIQLTDFQHKLLVYFLENPEVTRTQGEISQLVWPNKVTTVDAFNKPLGAIRNALSNNAREKKNHYIKTWAREGYSLGCSCTYVKGENGSRLWSKRVLAVCATVVLIVLASTTLFTPAIYQVTNPIRLTSLQGIVTEPSLTDDGKYIAFTFYDVADKGQIFAKKLSERDHVVLTKGHTDKMPSWSPKGDKLVYQRSNINQCEIRLITFTSPLVIDKNQLIHRCSSTSFFVSFTWQSDNAFYFTDSTTKLGPKSIYLFNLKSGLSSLYLAPELDINNESTGFARIAYQRTQDKLYIIQSPDWINTEVHVYGDKKLVKLASIDVSLSSVGLFNDSFVYKDSRNRLMLASQEQQSLTTEFNRPILHPVISQNARKIAYYVGHIYQWNVYSFNTKNQKKQQLTFDNAADRFPIKTADNLYYSSDFTGITQIYRQPVGSSNQPVQLTNFKINRRPTHISISPNGKVLAISYASGTDLHQIIENSLQPLATFETLIYPSFSPDSQKVMLTQLSNQGRHASIEYDLATRQPTGVNIPESRFAIYHQNGIIYAKTNEPGLYTSKNGTTRTINTLIKVFTPAHISVSNDALYATDTIDNSVKKISLIGDEVTTLPITKAGQLYHYKGIIYYTLERLGESSIYVGDIVQR